METYYKIMNFENPLYWVTVFPACVLFGYLLCSYNVFARIAGIFKKRKPGAVCKYCSSTDTDAYFDDDSANADIVCNHCGRIDISIKK